MEIQNYLHAIRRRIWLPILLPVVAAALTVGLIYVLPEQYQATATVVVPALSARGFSTSAATQYVSTYKDVLISAPVINQVSLQTGEKKADLVAGLSATTTTSSSNIILVTYVGPRRKTVEAVVRAASIDSLDTLLAPQVSAAQVEVTNSMKALETAHQGLANFTPKSDLKPLFPEDDYKILNQEVLQLQLNLTEATLAHDVPRSNALRAVIAKRNADLAVLADDVTSYRQLSTAYTIAQTNYAQANADLIKATSAVAADSLPGAVYTRVDGHVSRVPLMVRFGLVAAAIAFLLSIGLIVLMEFMRPAVPMQYASLFPLFNRRPRKARVRATGSEQGELGAAASGDEPTVISNGDR